MTRPRITSQPAAAARYDGRRKAAQIAAAPGTQRENLITWLQDRSQ